MSILFNNSPWYEYRHGELNKGQNYYFQEYDFCSNSLFSVDQFYPKAQRNVRKLRFYLFLHFYARKRMIP